MSAEKEAQSTITYDTVNRLNYYTQTTDRRQRIQQQEGAVAATGGRRNKRRKGKNAT